jgi:hypothetical protein
MDSTVSSEGNTGSKKSDKVKPRPGDKDFNPFGMGPKEVREAVETLVRENEHKEQVKGLFRDLHEKDGQLLAKALGMAYPEYLVMMGAGTVIGEEEADEKATRAANRATKETALTALLIGFYTVLITSLIAWAKGRLGAVKAVRAAIGPVGRWLHDRAIKKEVLEYVR